MLRQVHRALPRSWTVLVLADRGLYARWVFRRITRLGWHPFLRINTGGTFRPQGQVRGVPLKTLVPQPGTTWQGTGIAFKSRHRQLHCTLLACWEAGYKDPWLLLTDLPPAASTACWYGLRAWIEQGFKITKRAGWQWQRTQMTKPERAARLWLVSVFRRGWNLIPGGVAGSGPAAPGPLRPRILASGAGAADPIPTGAGAAPSRVRLQAAGAIETGMQVKT
jgi:Transposase DDE domain